MAETVRVSVYIRTNKVGSECRDEIEFDRDEWEGMSEEEREDACRDVAFNYMEWGWAEL